MTTYRTGNHWGVTIVRENDLSIDTGHAPRPVAAELVAVVTNGDTALAERICALLNGQPPVHMSPDHNLFRCQHPDCQRDAELAALADSASSGDRTGPHTHGGTE